MKLLLLFILISCAGVKNKNIVFDNYKFDSFSNESLSGYSLKRLESVDETLVRTNKALSNDQILSKYHNNFMYWNALGNSQLVNKNYSKALYNYKLALGLAKSQQEKSILYNNQALLFWKLSKYEDAITYFRKSSKLNPSAKTPRFNLAMVLYQHNFFSKSEKILSSLYRYKKNDLILKKYLAKTYIKLKKYRKAVNILKTYPNDLIGQHGVERDLKFAQSKLPLLESKQKVALSNMR